MKTFVGLVLILILLASCDVYERIVVHSDMSSERIIEFEFRDAPGLDKDDLWSPNVESLEEVDTSWIASDNSNQEAIDTEDEDHISKVNALMGNLSNISNLSIDTLGESIISLSFSVTKQGVQVNDEMGYNSVINEMSNDIKWYPKYRMNTFESMSSRELMIRIIDVNVYELNLADRQALIEELTERSITAVYTFPRPIESVSSDNVIISADRRTISYAVDLTDIVELKVPNELVVKLSK